MCAEKAKEGGERALLFHVGRVHVPARADVKRDDALHQRRVLFHHVVADDAAPVMDDKGGVGELRLAHRLRQLDPGDLEGQLIEWGIRQVWMEVLPGGGHAAVLGIWAVAEGGKLRGEFGGAVGPAMHEEHRGLPWIPQLKCWKGPRVVVRRRLLHFSTRRQALLGGILRVVGATEELVEQRVLGHRDAHQQRDEATPHRRRSSRVECAECDRERVS